MKKLQQLLKQDTGATAIEYALIAGATGLVLIAVMPTLGSSLDGIFNSLAAGL